MSWLERKIPLPSYANPVDERINTDTHLVGTLLAMLGLLVTLACIRDIHSIRFRTGMVVYALSNILLYLSSTLYHGSYMFLAFMYLIVASGITVTILFWEKLKVVHVILYLIMGWLCVFFSADIFPFIPSGIVKFLLLGGLSYTFGLVFYAVKKIPHYHGIWHVFVLLGSIFFYVGILFYLT